MAKAKSKQRKSPRALPRAETSWTVDPLSDLVSAQELRVWRSDPTTAKVLRYLGRWREQLKEYMAEGGTLGPTVEQIAIGTLEASAKAQLLKDLITLEARDIASFYGLGEPQDKAKEK